MLSKKKKKNGKKSKNRNFTILWTNLVETSARSRPDFEGSESDAYFEGRYRLKSFVPYGPMLTKTNRKISNI